jgi:hypothetical protein
VLALSPYLGIVIEQSLRDPLLIDGFDVVATRRGRAWTFHLVSVAPERLEQQVAALQAGMVTDDCWYAHFFRGDELAVVYRDAVFWAGVDPATWAPAVEHGLAHGVPLEQLDFKPRTEAEARAFFGLPQ